MCARRLQEVEDEVLVDGKCGARIPLGVDQSSCLSKRVDRLGRAVQFIEEGSMSTRAVPCS